MEALRHGGMDRCWLVPAQKKHESKTDLLLRVFESLWLMIIDFIDSHQ